MRNKVKRLFASCLVLVMCLGSTFNVHASEKFTMPEGEIVEINTDTSDGIQIMPLSLYKSGDFALGSNQKSFDISFNSKNGGNDPHTRFDMQIRSVTGGQWYAKITSAAGYSYTTSQYSGSADINVKNLNANTTYKVTMYWVSGTSSVSGKYTMWTSYQ